MRGRSGRRQAPSTDTTRTAGRAAAPSTTSATRVGPHGDGLGGRDGPGRCPHCASTRSTRVPPRRGRGALPGAMAWDRSGARRAGGCRCGSPGPSPTPPSAVSSRRCRPGIPWWVTTIPQSRARPTVTGPPSQDSPTWAVALRRRTEESQQTGPPAEFQGLQGVTAWPTRRRARHCRFTVGSIRPGSPAQEAASPPSGPSRGQAQPDSSRPKKRPIRVPHGRSRRTLGAPLAPRSHHGCVHRLPRRPAAGRRENLGVSIKGLRDLLRPGGDALGHHRPGRACGLHEVEIEAIGALDAVKDPPEGRLDGRVYHAMMAAGCTPSPAGRPTRPAPGSGAGGAPRFRPSADVRLSWGVSADAGCVPRGGHLKGRRRPSSVPPRQQFRIRAAASVKLLDLGVLLVGVVRGRDDHRGEVGREPDGPRRNSARSPGAGGPAGGAVRSVQRFARPSTARRPGAPPRQHGTPGPEREAAEAAPAPPPRLVARLRGAQGLYMPPGPPPRHRRPAAPGPRSRRHQADVLGEPARRGVWKMRSSPSRGRAFLCGPRCRARAGSRRRWRGCGAPPSGSRRSGARAPSLGREAVGRHERPHQPPPAGCGPDPGRGGWPTRALRPPR